MTRTRLQHLLALVFVALAAGAIAARADDSGQRKAPRVATPAVPVASRGARVFTAKAPCAVPVKPKTGGAPPSQALLGAFAILRRPAQPGDALSDGALKVLKRFGLTPVAPDSARLLRTTASGGRAWVVPVPDVSARLPFRCGKTGAPTPREGLAVVAVGDAAQGGGGALTDLVRGRAPVSTDSCAGPSHDMLGVSGIVPDGVPAVFLTAPDGTAVRADVKDNAYEFLVAHPRTPQQRYVVWTGGDGTPHVQPIGAMAAPPARVCSQLSKMTALVPRVSPGPSATSCAVPPVVAVPLSPKILVRQPKGPRRLPVPVYLGGCVEPGPFFVLPGPVPVPKRHR